MLRSMLVGLDGSAYSTSATELGIRWASKFDALLVGQAVVDEPMITTPEATPMGAAYYKGERDVEMLVEARRKTENWLEAFSLRCTQAGIASKQLQDEGDPVEQIKLQAQRYDLILLGQKTFFRFETQNGPCDTLEQLLHETARPVVAVPEKLPDGESIIVAYDGSPESARAVLALQATGLAEKYPVLVITVGDDHQVATKIAERAAEYLGQHGAKVSAKAISLGRKVGERLLEQAGEWNAQLLVMGAFGHSPLYEFFFGSTTQRILRHTWLPVMMFH